MDIIEYAKTELALAGYNPIDELSEDDPNRWVQENVLGLLDVFNKQGHSGLSAPYIIGMFASLALYEPLTPLTGEDYEWEEAVGGIYQNKRMSSVFKDQEGNAEFIDAIVWVDQNGVSFTGPITIGSTTYTSSQPVSFPLIPKTFFVKIERSADGEVVSIDNAGLSLAMAYYRSGNNTSHFYSAAKHDGEA